MNLKDKNDIAMKLPIHEYYRYYSWGRFPFFFFFTMFSIQVSATGILVKLTYKIIQACHFFVWKILTTYLIPSIVIGQLWFFIFNSILLFWDVSTPSKFSNLLSWKYLAFLFDLLSIHIYGFHFIPKMLPYIFSLSYVLLHLTLPIFFFPLFIFFRLFYAIP